MVVVMDRVCPDCDAGLDRPYLWRDVAEFVDHVTWCYRLMLGTAHEAIVVDDAAEVTVR